MEAAAAPNTPCAKRGAGLVRSTEERTASCGSTRPSFSRNGRDQIPPASTTASAHTVPCSVTTPRTRPPSQRSPRTAQPSSTRAPRRRARRATAGNREPRLRVRVRGRVQRTREPAVGAPEERVSLRGRQQAGVGLERPRALQPGGVAREVGLRLREVGRAARAVADVLLHLGSDPAPKVGGLDHQGQLLRRPALLADPTPVARGLLARDAALLQERDGHAALGQRQRRARRPPRRRPTTTTPVIGSGAVRTTAGAAGLIGLRLKPGPCAAQTRRGARLRGGAIAVS